MTARKDGPAWFYPGGNMDRRPGMIRRVHTNALVDLIMDDGSVEPMVPYFGIAGDPHDRHAYQPDPNDNVDLDAIRGAREGRMGIPGSGEAPEPEPDGPMEFDSVGSDPGDEDPAPTPGHTPGADPQPSHGNDGQHGHNQGGQGKGNAYGHDKPKGKPVKDGW